MKPNNKEITKIDGNTTSYSKDGIMGNARIRVKKNVNQVVKRIALKVIGQPHDEVLLTTDRRFEHYKSNEDGLILKDGLLFRKYHEKIGSIKDHEILISRQ